MIKEFKEITFTIDDWVGEVVLELSPQHEDPTEIYFNELYVGVKSTSNSGIYFGLEKDKVVSLTKYLIEFCNDRDWGIE